jgi:cell wall assembly regulator SMI1
MEEIWQRIKNYLNSQNSSLREEVAEPIQDNAFANYLHSLNIPLDDFYESLRIHNGQKYEYYALSYP